MIDSRTCPQCSKPSKEGASRCSGCGADLLSLLTTKPPSSVPRDTTEAASHIGEFRILRTVGRGGTGTVYEAHQESMQRRVALKVLDTGFFPSEREVARFEREAWIAGRLTHPNIVKVFGKGQEGQTRYIAMEFVEGTSLHDEIEKARKDRQAGEALASSSWREHIRKMVELFVGIADALHHVHEQGIIHRDIKPLNLLLPEKGSRLLLTDFGLARDLDATRMTRRGDFMGTIRYMSPEQLLASRVQVDHRSDIYSLGVSLYEAVTLDLPYAGDSEEAYISAVSTKDPVSARKRNQAVPRDLETVLMKCLERDPGRRYKGADELQADLERYLGDRPVEARRPGILRRGKRLASRQRAVVIAVLLTLILSAVGFGWLANRFESARQLFSRITGVGARTMVLVLPLEVRGQEEGGDYVGQAFAEALARNLTLAKGVAVLPVPLTAPDVGEDSFPPSAERVLSGVLTRKGDLVEARLSLVDTNTNQSLWEGTKEMDSKDLALLASSLARKVVTELGGQMPTLYIHFEELTTNSRLLGSQLYLEALAAVRCEEVEAAVATTERLVEAMPHEPEAQVLRSFALFADAWAQASTSPARHRYERQLANLVRLDPDTPWADIFQAKFLSNDSRYSESVQQFDRVLERDDLTPALRSYALRSRSQAHQYLRDRVASFLDLKEALKLDPVNDDVYSVYSTILREAGSVQDATTSARQALAINPSEDNLWPLAWALQGLAAWEEASGLWDRVCRRSQNQGYCASYAYTLERAGRSDEARVAAQLAEELPEFAWGVYTLARYHGVAGDRADALEWLSHFLEIESYPEPDAAYHSDFKLLRGDPGFESLVAEEWKVAANYFRESCKDTPSQSYCAFYAVSLARTGDEQGARAAAQKAGELPESEAGCLYLARYSSLTGDRDGVIRMLKRYLELRVVPDPDFPADHPDFAGMCKDAEFRALASRIKVSGLWEVGVPPWRRP